MAGAGEENLGRLREVYARWAEGDLNTVEIFHPDVELVWAPEMIDTNLDRGVEALSRSIRRMMEGARDIQIHAKRMIPKDDRIVVIADWHMVGRSTGLASSVEVVHIWTFSGGRASRLEGYYGLEEGLQATGLELDEP
jgi:ketosteroid isomerase-like protein